MSRLLSVSFLLLSAAARAQDVPASISMAPITEDPTHLLALVTDSGLLESRDAGLSWQVVTPISRMPAATQHVYGPLPANGPWCLGVWGAQEIYCSYDHGKTFESRSIADSGGHHTLNELAVDAADGNHLIGTLWPGESAHETLLVESRDGGRSFVRRHFSDTCGGCASNSEIVGALPDGAILAFVSASGRLIRIRADLEDV